MSPIKGLSEQRRIPRCDKIHLGYRDPAKKGAPTATDYFVCPPVVQKVYGQKPKELPIMIPVEDEEYWASQYYRCYSQTRGLVCKGDGEKCRRMVDVKTEEMANHDSTAVVWKELPCEGKECPSYQKKQCREMMCLQFLLPDVPGVGVWQIDTSSINSIRNINSTTELIRGICGRIRMIPLLLTLEKIEIVNPDDGKKKRVCVLNFRQQVSLQALLASSQKPVHELLAPAPADDEEPLDTNPEVEEATEELWETEEATTENKTETFEELAQDITVNMGWRDSSFIRSWLRNTCHIPEQKLTDVAYVRKAVWQLQDWK